MSGRKKRPEDEGKGHRVPPEGAEVFKPAKDDRRPQVQIPLSHDPDGTEHGIVGRWPTSMGSGVQYGSPPREVIYMDQKSKTGVTYPDPYLDAEEAARSRRGAA